jgi:hypothetical protein
MNEAEPFRRFLRKIDYYNPNMFIHFKMLHQIITWFNTAGGRPFRVVKSLPIPNVAGYIQVIGRTGSGCTQKVVWLKPMPALTMQYGWHICNQNVRHIMFWGCFCWRCWGSFSLISAQKWFRARRVSRESVKPIMLSNLGRGLKTIKNNPPKCQTSKTWNYHGQPTIKM